jgi:hypothetical protein
MPDLAQRFLCIGEEAEGNPRLLVHASEQTSRPYEIRPPRPDERGCVVAARDWVSAESVTLILGVAIGLAFVASVIPFRDGHLKREFDRQDGRQRNGRPHCRSRVQW